MVNYKRVVCILAVVTVAVAAPTDCRDPSHTHYDQRQNGTDNYRLNIDGVVIAVAPAESLLAAASEIDFGDLFDLEELDSKPPPAEPQRPLLEPKPQEVKPEAPQEVKPEAAKPDEALSNVKMTDDVHSQKKEASTIRKHESKGSQRLKNRLAQILMPLLRKTRHH